MPRGTSGNDDAAQKTVQARLHAESLFLYQYIILLTQPRKLYRQGSMPSGTSGNNDATQKIVQARFHAESQDA